MKYTWEFGIAAPEIGWVPSPTFILRRAAILRIISDWQPGSLLEMGCGSGAICHELSQRGFICTGVESSAAARDIATQLTVNSSIQIATSMPGMSTQFDYLFSFEVLEHIEDDVAALTDWLQRLKPGGVCLLSVPAHRKRWNITDIAAGHFRRYDRQDVLALVDHCGLESVEIMTYGWPASRLIEILRKWAKTRQLKKGGIEVTDIKIGDETRTGLSGIERTLESKLFPYYANWFGRKIMWLMSIIQIPFTRTDLGISYVIKAIKPND